MKTSLLRHVGFLFIYLFIVWGSYRLLIKLPDTIEEIIIKPLIWITPVIFLVKKEKLGLNTIGITFDNFFRSVYISLILGSVFVMVAVTLNYFKYGRLNFGANLGNEGLFLSLGLSFATAISEEITFRGYIFTRLWRALGDESRYGEWQANLITSLAWTALHIPITIFVNKLDPLSAIIYLFLTFIFGIGSAFLYGRTKNIGSSIFLHVLWEWPIILFR